MTPNPSVERTLKGRFAPFGPPLIQGQVWMLTLYPKNVVDNISAHVLKQIKDETDG